MAKDAAAGISEGAKNTLRQVMPGEDQLRRYLAGVRAYREAEIATLAYAMDVKRRCTNVAMHEAMNWLCEQQHPITVFDFSDWCEEICGKEAL